MKRKIISWLALVAVFLVSYSCRMEQDSLADKNSDHNNHDVVSFKTFLKETNIQKVGQALSENSTLNKNVQQSNPLSRFIIDTTHINRIIANNSLSTYAFRIYSLYGSPQDLYNMVYRKRSNGTVQYSILKITNTEVSLVYDSEKEVFFQKKAHHGSTAKTPCTDYYAEFFHCKNGHSWDNCDKCADCVTTIHIVYGDCGGSSGTGNGNTYPQNLPNPTPAEGSGGSYNMPDPSGYVFDPNEMPTIDPQYVRASRAYLFWTQLDYNNQMFATEHPDIYQNLIEHYLNNFSTVNNVENLNFHNQAMQYFVDHPDTTWEQFYNQFISNPCEKTKELIKKQEVKNSIDALYNQSKLNGEKAFMVQTDGTPGALIPGNETSVNLGDISGNKGYYHNHPADQPNRKGVKILSPRDIYKLFEFIVIQPPGTPVSDSFAGMVASMPCGSPSGCSPDGYLYQNFIVTFTGTLSDAQTIKNKNFTKEDFDALSQKYSEFEASIRNLSEYASQYGNFMNFKGLEKVFFNALDKMGIDKNMINLQRIDKNGKVYNVSLDASGTPIETPCP